MEPLEEGRIPAALDLEHDAALLALGAPAVRVAILADRTVSLGVARPASAALAGRAAARGIPFVRRSTGGTGVLHLPGDLAWSAVLPRSDPRAGRDFVRAYGRLGAAAAALLGDLSLAAAWVPAPGLSEELCLLGSRGEVLAVQGRVVGGAAQHLSGSAILHHGVIGVETDLPLESELFSLPEDLLRARRAGLRDLGVAASSEWLAARLLALLRGWLTSGPGRRPGE